MIFVTLGSQMFSFNRLVNEISRINKQGTEETFYVQYGHTNIENLNISGKPFLNESEFDTAIDDCNILITHGGTSNIIKALKRKKKIIIVPRLKEHNEHVDDHQLEIAEFVESNNFGLVVKDISKLNESIRNIKEMKFEEYRNDNSLLLDDIKEFIIGGV